ncbi:hypothetical protein Corgl_1420 [Coriobacterium glomerans PW2]|uniref:Uncharacterized protein n=1 Tax=Coriobacterium glomerans (strain ATCC 49209 / DSM 20642 / JCM 10262 / PW2) TaxID=700015 RepID=F2NAR5_CORGP|nr:hypothetical protein [Coriobacterium glomerans]AEB07521.1 hypothetical protein Corgl_1420 [Coriobacterium glomerans PW2]
MSEKDRLDSRRASISIDPAGPPWAPCGESTAAPRARSASSAPSAVRAPVDGLTAARRAQGESRAGGLGIGLTCPQPGSPSGGHARPVSATLVALASAAVGIALAILLILVVGGAIMAVVMRDDSSAPGDQPAVFQTATRAPSDTGAVSGHLCASLRS